MNNIEITFGDDFEGYEKSYSVSKAEILSTIRGIARVQEFEYGLTLFYKTFESERLKHLIVATQIVKGKTLFQFAFWIPEEFFKEEGELIELIDQFLIQFGIKIKINDEVGFLFRNNTVTIEGPLRSVSQLFSFAGWSHVSYELMIFLKENLINNINRVDVHYCFVLNTSKYQTWLLPPDLTDIKIPSGWVDYLKGITDLLEPTGRTRLRILNSKTVQSAHGNINTQSTIQIPSVYSKVFSHIAKVINDLPSKGKILIVPEPRIQRCVFCGKHNPSDEHIFPKWHRAFFENKKIQMQIVAMQEAEFLSAGLESAMPKSEEDSYGITSQRVCIECNNGWLSQLESSVKDIFVKKGGLVNTIKELELNQEKRFMLAKWLLAKSILLTLRYSVRLNVPSECLPLLMQNVILDGFVFEISEDGNFDLAFAMHEGLAHPNFLKLSSNDESEARKNSNSLFSVGMKFGCFLFRTSFFPPNTGLQRVSFGKKTQILHPEGFRLLYDSDPAKAAKWEALTGTTPRIVTFTGSFMLTDRK